MRTRAFAGAAMTAALLFTSAAAAQQDGHSTAGQEDTSWSMPEVCQGMPSEMSAEESSGGGESAQADATQDDASAVVEAYMAEMQEMMENMPDDPAGDPDVDYVRRVIPHHQGLLEMSQVYLDHGQDEMIRKMAELFIVAQRGHIATMCNWLEKHRA